MCILGTIDWLKLYLYHCWSRMRINSIHGLLPCSVVLLDYLQFDKAWSVWCCRINLRRPWNLNLVHIHGIWNILIIIRCVLWNWSLFDSRLSLAVCRLTVIIFKACSLWGLLLVSLATVLWRLPCFWRHPVDFERCFNIIILLLRNGVHRVC